MSTTQSFVQPFTSNKPYLFDAIYQWILDNDGTPHLVVDTLQADVNVPWQHVQNDKITLNISPSAISNWHSDHEAISFSARFSGKAQNIYIPMSSLIAVYAEENGLGMSFPTEERDEDSSSKNDNIVAVSKEDKIEPEEQNEKSVQKKDKSKKISHLKVIK
jgi:stringent starvation protein B